MNADLSNGQVLAFIGDSVMTLWVREYLVDQGMTNAKDLQVASNTYVSAKAQAKVMIALLADDFLDEKEIEIYHLGRNYKGHSKAKNVDIKTYKIASGFEALWGYWHLKNNPQRLCELWDKTRTIVEEDLC